MNINLTSATVKECIKSTKNLSARIYRNICDGTEFTVQNGFWDHVGYLFIFAFCVGVVALILAGAAVMFRG